MPELRVLRRKSSDGTIEIEVWKKLVDLHIHHDNLKQSRIRHFLTVQTAFVALYGVCVTKYIESTNCPAGLLILAGLIGALALIMATLTKQMDTRARKYTRVIKDYLWSYEKRMSCYFGPGVLDAYTTQRAILDLGTHVYSQETGALAASKHRPGSASRSEGRQIFFFQLFWGLAILLAPILGLTKHLDMLNVIGRY